MPNASLLLPAEMQRMDEYRAFVLDKADKAGLPEAMHGKLELILEELLVNVVSYAYPDGDGEVQISCVDTGDGQFGLSIRDWGPAFDPLKDAREPDLEAGVDDRPIGGLGIFFVKEMSDGVTYERDGDANVLTILFNLPD